MVNSSAAETVQTTKPPSLSCDTRIGMCLINQIYCYKYKKNLYGISEYNVRNIKKPLMYITVWFYGTVCKEIQQFFFVVVKSVKNNAQERNIALL